MAPNKAALSDEDFLLSHLSEYLDESLSPADRQKFEDIAKRTGATELATDYGIRRGQLQIEAQRLFMNEKKMRTVHELVEDDAARANNEAAEIEEVGASELKGNVVRFVALAAFFAIIFGGIYYYFKPEAKPAFNALNSLIYEADVMNENSEGRLAFPTDKLDEVNDYFKKLPELGYQPKVLKPLPADWTVGGATLIDYDGAKITVAQFINPTTKDKQYLFFYLGKLSQLPKSAPGNANGLIYQTYASSNLNVVAWEVSPEVVGMLIGNRSAKDLADFAYKVVGP